jgi:hypothetical protein
MKINIANPPATALDLLQRITRAAYLPEGAHQDYHVHPGLIADAKEFLETHDQEPTPPAPPTRAQEALACRGWSELTDQERANRRAVEYHLALDARAKGIEPTPAQSYAYADLQRFTHAALIDFARETLSILANSPDWNADTLDAIAQNAFCRNLADAGDDTPRAGFRAIVPPPTITPPTKATPRGATLIDALADHVRELATDYAELLAEYGQPFKWGLIPLETAAQTLARVEWSHSMSGAMVLGRTADSIFLRIPENLAEPINGGCGCDYCQANPDKVPRWDCLVIGATAPAKGNDFASHCHMPDAGSVRLMNATRRARK